MDTIIQTCVVLFFTCFTTFIKSDIVDDYVRYRDAASCNNINVCNTDILAEYFNGKTFRFGSKCCSSCSCDSDCYQRGECCPDILLESPPENNLPPGGVYRCVLARMKNRNGKKYFMITKCRTNYTNSKIIRKCGEDPSSGLDYFLTVTSTASGNTYRNQYCAECNFEEPAALTSWQLQLDCTSDTIKKITPNTLLEDVLAIDSCDLSVIKPDNVSVERCYDVIDTCNQTGRWLNYNINLATACDLYRAPFAVEFRNIFCQLCNWNTDIPIDDCRVTKHEGKIGPPTISLLFDFNHAREVIQAETKIENCPQGTVYIPYLDACYVANCEPGFNYTDEQCDPADDPPCMEAFLVLRPVTNLTDVRLKDIEKAIVTAINDTNILPIADLSWDIHYSIGMRDFAFHAMFLFNASISRSLVEFCRQPLNVSIQIFGSNSSGTIDMSFDVTLRSDIELFTNFRDPFTNVNFHSFELPGSGLVRPGRFYNDGIEPLCLKIGGGEVLTIFTACVWIEIELENFDVSLTGEFLHFHDFDVSLSDKTFTVVKVQNNDTNNVSEATIKVCVDDMPTKMAQLRNDVNTQLVNKNTEVLSYLTLSTSILSIISCMFTFITYILLKPLCTQPGINNMMLSFVILLGHVLFLTGPLYNLSPSTCMIMGGVLHFLWLSVMLWYLICSFHMFRVFHMSVPQLDNNIISTTLKYTVFVTITSLCLIVVNVVTTAIITDGEDFGYTDTGAQLCWISEPILLGLTITLPALVTVICNIVLFIIASYRIGQGVKVELRSNKNRQTFLIYIKLSALTGITWLTIIPYIFSRMAAFNYIFTILNGCNGFFLMLAFMINKRVFMLYKSLFCGAELTQDSSLRTTQTTIKESNRGSIKAKDRESGHPANQTIVESNPYSNIEDDTID